MGNKCCTCKESTNSTSEAGEQKNPISTPVSHPEDKTTDEYRGNDTSRADNNTEQDSNRIAVVEHSAALSKRKPEESEIGDVEGLNNNDNEGLNNEIAKINVDEEEGAVQDAKEGDCDFPPISMSKIMDKIKKEEEIDKGLKLLDIVSSDNILSKDPDKVIYEDEILRFSAPGVSRQQYHAKWAQITKREFRYFKDRISSAEWLARPLVAIPLHRIVRVGRVSVKIGKGMAQAKNEKGPYQFEIFVSNGETARSPREQVEEDKREGNVKSSKAILYDPKLQKSALSGVPQKDKNSYLEYVKTKATALTKVAIKQKIEGQGHSAWIPSLSGTDTWSSRQKIWKTVQARHVFAHASKAECEKWVFVLNWIIDVIKQK